MRELALHVLDLVQNSLRAGARLIEVEIMEDTDLDSLVITRESRSVSSIISTSISRAPARKEFCTRSST